MERPIFREEGHEQESAREYADRKAIWIGIKRGDIKPPRPIETIKTVVVREKADLSDTLARMEAAAARAAQPGANIPERIKEFADENLTPAQNREAMLKRLSDLGNLIQMGLGTTENKAEYAAYNASMDWLRGA